MAFNSRALVKVRCTVNTDNHGCMLQLQSQDGMDVQRDQHPKQRRDRAELLRLSRDAKKKAMMLLILVMATTMTAIKYGSKGAT